MPIDAYVGEQAMTAVPAAMSQMVKVNAAFRPARSP